MWNTAHPVKKPLNCVIEYTFIYIYIYMQTQKSTYSGLLGGGWGAEGLRNTLFQKKLLFQLQILQDLPLSIICHW